MGTECCKKIRETMCTKCRKKSKEMVWNIRIGGVIIILFVVSEIGQWLGYS